MHTPSTNYSPKLARQSNTGSFRSLFALAMASSILITSGCISAKCSCRCYSQSKIKGCAAKCQTPQKQQTVSSEPTSVPEITPVGEPNATAEVTSTTKKASVVEETSVAESTSVVKREGRWRPVDPQQNQLRPESVESQNTPDSTPQIIDGTNPENESSSRRKTKTTSNKTSPPTMNIPFQYERVAKNDSPSVLDSSVEVAKPQPLTVVPKQQLADARIEPINVKPINPMPTRSVPADSMPASPVIKQENKPLGLDQLRQLSPLQKLTNEKKPTERNNNLPLTNLAEQSIELPSPRLKAVTGSSRRPLDAYWQKGSIETRKPIAEVKKPDVDPNKPIVLRAIALPGSASNGSSSSIATIHDPPSVRSEKWAKPINPKSNHQQTTERNHENWR